MLSRHNVASPQIGPRHGEMENKPSAILSSMDGAKAGACYIDLFSQLHVATPSFRPVWLPWAISTGYDDVSREG